MNVLQLVILFYLHKSLKMQKYVFLISLYGSLQLKINKNFDLALKKRDIYGLWHLINYIIDTIGVR